MAKKINQGLNSDSNDQDERTISDLNNPFIQNPEVSELNVGSNKNAVSELAQAQNFSPDIIQNEIPNSVLSEINRDNSPTTIDDAINRSIFGKLPKRTSTVEQAPMIQQGGELMRGLNDNILKGNVSGSVIGNQPIFVGGGDTMAIDVLNNRQKAIQDAAIVEQQKSQEFLSKTAPIVKDQRFQKGLNDQFNTSKENYIRMAEEEYGSDWATALQDQSNPIGRAFVQDMANYDFVAGQADQVTDFIADIDKNLASGENIYSEDTLELRDQYDQLQGAFLNGDISGVIDLASKFDELKGFANLDRIINDQGIDIKGTVNGFASIIDKDNRFETVTQKKTEYEDQVRIIANGLAKGQMRDSVRKGLITEEEIFNRLNARYGYENIVEKKVTSKSGAGGKFTINLNDEYGEPKTEKVSGTDYTVYDAVEVPTNVKPLSASGLTVVNPDGTTSKVDGVRNVDLNSFQVVEVRDPNNPNKFIKKKVVVGTHTEKGKLEEGTEGKEFEITALYDMDQIGSRIKTDLLQDPEEWERMNERFNQELQEEVELDDVSGFKPR